MTRVGVVQLEARVGAVEENLARAEEHLRSLAAQDVEIAVLPELFGSGYDLAVDQRELAERTGEKVLSGLELLAAELDMVLVSAVLVLTRVGTVVDQAVVVGPGGILDAAGKRYLWGEEVAHFTAASGVGALAATPVGTVGVAVCYEVGFPETARDLAVRGADLIGVPAAFGLPRLHAWELSTRSRALENGCFVLAAGLTGSNPSGVRFAGHSRVVDPRGEVLATLALEEGCVTVDVDLALVGTARGEIPYLRSLSDDAARAAAPPIPLTHHCTTTQEGTRR